MAKLTLSTIGNIETAATTLNANNDLVEAALENTLSRDGTSPNSMGADLDMNSNRITNLPVAISDAEPLRKGEFDDAIDDIEATEALVISLHESFTDRYLGPFSSAPTATATGQLYFNTITKALYVWDANQWVIIGNGESAYEVAVNNGFVGDEDDWLLSLIGEQGEQGDAGAAGADGASWYSDAGVPAGGVGVVGDFYLNETNGDFYEKTGASSWTLQGNLQGPQGDAGVGLPVGGTAGQVLIKDSGTDYDVSWDTPAGGGDMLAATYDPTAVADDAFDMENMAEGATNKILTAAERTKLGHISVTQAVNLDTIETLAGAAQPGDADLTAIAGLFPSNDDVIQRKAGAWANRTMAQVKTDLALVKGDVGLGNVDNTSDANKPVSTAQQTALNLKANLASPTFTGTVTLPDDTVANTKLANMAQSTIKGRAAGAGTGDPTDLTGAQVTTICANSFAVVFVIDGGGSAVSTGAKAMVQVPFAATITGATIIGAPSGNAVVDVWKAAGALPTVANTITASAKPTLSGATYSMDTTLTGWTTSVAANDVIRVNVDSAATCTFITVSLRMTRN